MALTADLLEGIDRLESLPITAQRLVKALDDERIGPAQIADYIEYDPAVASSVLRLANSAAWAGSIPTATVRDAVVRLGAARLLDIVLGNHMRGIKMRAPLYDLAENEIRIRLGGGVAGGEGAATGTASERNSRLGINGCAGPRHRQDRHGPLYEGRRERDPRAAK